MSLAYLAILRPRGSAAHQGQGRTSHSSIRWLDISRNISIATDVPHMLTIFPGGTGFLFGTLFHRHGPADPVDGLPPDEIETIRATRGQHLIDRYWGRYIAVIQAERGHYVLRDPSGALPCYFAVSRDTLALSSDPSLLVDGGVEQPDIDYSGVARALLLAGLPEEETALTGVQELLPGTCLLFDGADLSTKIRWNPWDFTSEPDRTIEEQVGRLRRATECSVGGWARLYGKPLLSISGGLDSSIVGACLNRLGGDFSCITVTTDDSLGDEREYSRAVARHLQRQLLEETYVLEHVDLGRSSVSHLPKPFGRLDATAYDAAVVTAAENIGAAAVFTGNGGDNVFFMSRSARPLADRYLIEGLSMGLLRTIRDIHLLTGANVAQVIGQGMRAWRNAAAGYVWKREAEFLSKEAVETASRRPIHHPWLKLPEGRSLPGKAAHIAMLLRMHYSLAAYYERNGIPFVHPLASQPLLECCLQISTWQQCDRGFDRSVARRAFAHALPDSIIERRVKGSPQGFSFQIFSRFRDEIRQRLLDGFLSNNGVLEKAQIEKMFMRGRPISGNEITRLLMLVDTEAWVQHWRATGNTEPNSRRAAIIGFGERVA
ncbi:asparagine synthase-related protein [Sphingobium sp. DC-2]|uniref:asparagine synthase-related protein n=1 Tax=Sphingobium sp. DC-2 TaxID=1303256 RepID=UPI0004C3530A|nr:asparagine synthase-related protein [Sphingobium sp. DC-2]